MDRNLQIKLCKECGSFFYNNRWISFNRGNWLFTKLLNEKLIEINKDNVLNEKVVEINKNTKKVIEKPHEFENNPTIKNEKNTIHPHSNQILNFRQIMDEIQQNKPLIIVKYESNHKTNQINTTINPDPKDKNSINKKQQISLNGTKIRNKKNREQITAVIKYKLCDTCMKFKSGYFEGILQIRNKDNNNYSEVIDLIYKKIENKKDIFIAKKIEMKDGVDFYLNSNKFLVSIGKDINSIYGGKIKVSRRLFSKDSQTSRELYRVTSLIRLPDYAKGDIIIYKNKIVLLQTIKQNVLIGLDLKLNKKTTLNATNELAIIKKTTFMEAIITQRKPQIHILNPETYETAQVENQVKLKKGTEKVQIAIIDQKVYLIPSIDDIQTIE